ncbi:BZ3500_MvSof-1268-A1-R1_Chr1-1g01045 [Microbotryum saponariae]|uniref:BZ3500_MvSof-1268-A1-R1_Chr1-1g01045 protein n=1 Tax=Microbotryum saponariae TaxID=289078 RepID=A0A2X0LBQ9_9BASI|nr:BZ3500_MvSof-1268-A1-R1_Chr1-1g01045 [Microbotryum saponariae]SCZ93283.1 BZ3501_MvSof-1269-A2-R1_Chr1-1g00642 [Microbotryum saponariae]
MSVFVGPTVQQALLLHAPRQRYQLSQIEVPTFHDDEVLIRIEAIGLNPIDHKSADYGFALPVLPALNGRDLAGVVVGVGSNVQRWRFSDLVFGPSTAYRDYRTSAFQEFAVASEHCLGSVPVKSSVEQCAALVAAALAIGSALGIAIRGFAPRSLAIGAEGESPEWVKTTGSPTPIQEPSAQFGDWILIWGGSTTSGYLAAQLARTAGLRVIAVANRERHEERLRAVGIEHVVDRDDPIAAVAKIREITGGALRYAIDCVGKTSASHALEALSLSADTYLVGLSGLPKTARSGVRLCEVPIKTFHTNAAVGSGLMRLLEELIDNNELVLPAVEVIYGGLEAVNNGLDRLRRGECGFGRIVIRTPHA